MSEVKPVLRVLTRKQREAVHHYACRILAETGVRVDWPEARDRLDAGGCRISGNGRVLFPETMIQEAISTAQTHSGTSGGHAGPGRHGASAGRRHQIYCRFKYQG